MICVLLFIPAGGILSGEKKSYLEVMVINPDGVVKSQNWGEVVTSRDLYIWGRSMGLYLVPDQAPLKDNRAAVIHRDGTVITAKNLHPGKSYTLFIDPVVFRNPDNRDISSRLEVSVRCERLGTHILADLHFSEMDRKGVISLPVPYIFTHTGCVDIVLQERSNRKTTWALWDMVLIAGDTLPSQIRIKKPVLPEKLEKKKKLKAAEKPVKIKKLKAVKKPKKKKKLKAVKKPVEKKEQTPVKKPVAKKEQTAIKKMQKTVKKPIIKKKPQKKLEIRSRLQKQGRQG